MLKGPRSLVLRARKLRREMSLPEVLLWQQLRERPGGLKFRKQHPGGFYVLDFFCAEAKLCIEIDGQGHSCGDQPQFDEARDAWLQLHGIDTLRIPAGEVLNNMANVVTHIVATARARIPPRHGEVAARSADGGVATHVPHASRVPPPLHHPAEKAGRSSSHDDLELPGAIQPAFPPPRAGEELA